MDKQEPPNGSRQQHTASWWKRSHSWLLWLGLLWLSDPFPTLHSLNTSSNQHSQILIPNHYQITVDSTSLPASCSKNFFFHKKLHQCRPHRFHDGCIMVSQKAQWNPKRNEGTRAWRGSKQTAKLTRPSASSIKETRPLQPPTIAPLAIGPHFSAWLTLLIQAWRAHLVCRAGHRPEFLKAIWTGSFNDMHFLPAENSSLIYGRKLTQASSGTFQVSSQTLQNFQTLLRSAKNLSEHQKKHEHPRSVQNPNLILPASLIWPVRTPCGGFFWACVRSGN